MTIEVAVPDLSAVPVWAWLVASYLPWGLLLRWWGFTREMVVDGEPGLVLLLILAPPAVPLWIGGYFLTAGLIPPPWVAFREEST